MINTDLTKKAMILAYHAHHTQVDKDGVPYIYHPIHLAEQMTTEYETIAALLHDVVEDTDVSIDDLIIAGFPDEVIEAVHLLTHEDDVDYFDYLKGIRANAIATSVKLADLAHNSEESRLTSLDEATADRLRKKYAKAKQYMNETVATVSVL
ncbi:MAG: HD domain-containing protein [Clostridiales Family XIII bacterium]|jgi:(p)ppGpp synthase/HD superfamily hydrolase|nr:HD domain-containing protein [Clostridiales Family XIII bacterium]